MTKELDVLRRHRPITSGPDPDLTDRALHSFSEFLDSQAPATGMRETNPTRKSSARRSLAIAALATTLIAAGGIAIAVIGDGVVYAEPATEITEVNGLTLVVQDSNKGTCLEVRTEDGNMAGGCGVQFQRSPLEVGIGFVSGRSFASGWAPHGTTMVVMTFHNGETMSVTAVQVVDGYDLVFFVASPLPLPGNQIVLPDRAAAYDAEGRTLATVSYGD